MSAPPEPGPLPMRLRSRGRGGIPPEETGPPRVGLLRSPGGREPRSRAGLQAVMRRPIPPLPAGPAAPPAWPGRARKPSPRRALHLHSVARPDREPSLRAMRQRSSAPRLPSLWKWRSPDPAVRSRNPFRADHRRACASVCRARSRSQPGDLRQLDQLTHAIDDPYTYILHGEQSPGIRANVFEVR